MDIIQKFYDIITQSNDINEIYSQLSEQFRLLEQQGMKRKEIDNLSKKVRDRINSEINNKILEGLGQGKTQTQIAKDLGLSRQCIFQRITKIREEGIKIPKIDKKIIDKKILERFREGITQTQMAKELGLTDATISYRIKKMIENGVICLDEMDEKIIERFKEGITQRQVTKELGLSFEDVSNRMKKMIKLGIDINEIIAEANKIPNISLSDEMVYDLRTDGLSFQNVANRLKSEGIEMSYETVRKKYLKVKESDQKLARGIVNLIKTRNATLEQVQLIAEYYNVDLNRTFNSLEERER